MSRDGTAPTFEGVMPVNRKLIRPSLTDIKEAGPSRAPQPVAQHHPPQHHSGGGAGGTSNVQRKKPTPPDQTNAESFYFVKQMQSRTPVAVVLTDGEILNGVVEWYDRDCIKLTRFGSPNLLLYKHVIKYMYKTGDDNAQGGTNGQ
jgi:host factor-I protein